mgnify:FL=1|jgi:hypothetical protein|tara:strand:+ start:52 stop:348 length:297 start_codon:yes stop_codon:yes gene_type:complete
MHYSTERQQHIEDTEFLMWSDGMYIMIDDLECDHELALIENSLRDSVYFKRKRYFRRDGAEDCLGADAACSGLWWSEDLLTKLTRAQALYIATGETCI